MKLHFSYISKIVFCEEYQNCSNPEKEEARKYLFLSPSVELQTDDS